MPASQRFSCAKEKKAPAGGREHEKGFTLFEVIIVLAVLAMFAAMAVPLTGRLEARGRVRETEQRLALVREALFGPGGEFDAAGRRRLSGYAGDLGGLPPLRRAAWDDDLRRWDWELPFADTAEGRLEADAYWASGMGQPRNLWLPPGEDPLARWRGPYLHEPRDEFPGNADHLRWTHGATLTHAQAETNREIEMRQTAGRLADAWGRSLLFFYVAHRPAGAEIFQNEPTAQTTVYIVSEGPDLQSVWPAFDTGEAANEDNLVLVITPQEWSDEARREETRRRLEVAREALVGRWGPVDRLGRPLLGGFVGDHGIWPQLYVWQGATAPWRRVEAADLINGALYGQPRGLWTQDTDGDGTPDLPLPPDPADPAVGNVLIGFGWRGPYLPRPDGTGEAELLRDAWGVPLRFRLSHADAADPPPAQTLTIISAGPDGEPDTTDDLREVVPRHFDVRSPIPPIILEGTVFNETDQDRRYRVRLHASPAHRPAVPPDGTEPRLVSSGTAWSFRLEVERSSAGPRLLELVEETYTTVDGSAAWRFYRRWDWTTVFIGSGGTAAPEREPLTLRAR